MGAFSGANGGSMGSVINSGRERSRNWVRWMVCFARGFRVAWVAGACGVVFHLSASSPKCFFGDTSLCSEDTRFWWKDPPPDFHTQWNHSLVRDGLKPAACLFSSPSAPPSYWRSVCFCHGFPCCALWISASVGTLWGRGSVGALAMRGQEGEMAMT